MEYEVFDRRYSLIIGRPSKTISQTIPLAVVQNDAELKANYLASTRLIKNSYVPPNQGVAIDYRTIPDSFIEIRDLSMRASIVYKKSGAKGGNQFSTIYLDNLTEETKDSIQENDLIFLRAGYRIDIQSNEVPYEDLPLILSGQITSVETTRDSNSGTKTTKIICGDNILPKKFIKVSKTWPKNTSKRRVLDDLLDVAKANFIPIGKVYEEIEGFISPFKQVYPFGYSVAGNLFDEINKLCESLDYRFYTAIGKIYIEPKSTKKTLEIVQIEKETLKAPLERYSDNSNKKNGDKDKNKGIVARLFLNGRVQSNMGLEINNIDSDWDGTYPIESISHKLDFEGNDWDTIIKTAKL